jgi:acetyltransferase-like isoleucine patch superfamily enzyme
MKRIRPIAKRLVFLISLTVTAPLIAICRIERLISDSEWIFTGCSQILALVPTMAGLVLRSAFYFGTLDQCDWEVHVGFGTIFSHRMARLARHVSIGAYCVLGKVQIGQGAMIGSRVSIPSGKRQHLNRDGELAAQGTYDTVKIGEETWIGEGAIVVADVGHHCIVGAGAVVSEQIEPMKIAVGNPARVLENKVEVST